MKKQYKQISLLLIILVVLGQIAGSWYAWTHAHNFLLKEAEEDLSGKMRLVRANNVLQQIPAIKSSLLKQTVDEIFRLSGLRITIIAKDGRVLADSSVPQDSLIFVDNHLQRQEVQQAAMHGKGTYSRVSRTINKRLLYYCEPIKREGKIVGFLRLAMFSPAFEAKTAFIQELILKVNIFFFVFAVVVIGTFGWWNRNQWKTVGQNIRGHKHHLRPGDWPKTNFEEVKSIYYAVDLILENAGKRLDTFQQQKKDLLDIFESLNDGVAAFDPEGRIIFYNRAFSSILEISKSEIENNPYWDFLHFPPLLQSIDNYFSKREIISETVKYYKGKWIEYHILPLPYSNPESDRFVLVCRDVTRLKELERIRSDFVTNVTHEFKTPLTSIRGFAETLYAGNADSQELKKRFLKKILNQTDRLENLVMDLIQLSKLEKRVIENLHPLNPVSVILEAVDDVSKTAASEKVRLITENLLGEDEIQVLGSADILQTIVLNLLINAIRYNRENGKVWVRLNKERNSFVLEVEDTGIGIPRSEQKRVFERFYRTNDAREKFQQGTGLGLAIVRHSVELIRGKIELESEPGRGSVFRVFLPIL